MPQPLVMLSAFLIGMLIEKVVKMSVLRTSPSHADRLRLSVSWLGASQFTADPFDCGYPLSCSKTSETNLRLCGPICGQRLFTFSQCLLQVNAEGFGLARVPVVVAEAEDLLAFRIALAQLHVDVLDDLPALGQRRGPHQPRDEGRVGVHQQADLQHPLDALLLQPLLAVSEGQDLLGDWVGAIEWRSRLQAAVDLILDRWPGGGWRRGPLCRRGRLAARVEPARRTLRQHDGWRGGVLALTFWTDRHRCSRTVGGAQTIRDRISRSKKPHADEKRSTIDTLERVGTSSARAIGEA